MTSFELKDLVDNLIYKTYNALSRSIYTLNYFNIKNIIGRNIELKNKHKGQRCFIIGTGPSLNEMDLTYLKNEVTFGVNFLFKSEQFKVLNPTYYAITDEFFHNQGKEYLEGIFNNTKNSIMICNYKGKRVVNSCKIKPKEVYYIYQKLFPHKKLTCVDAHKNMTIGMNVVTGCIQMAIYMGFSEIYLIGADFNSFASEKPNHCYTDDSNEREISLADELKFYSHATYFHYYIAKYAKDRNIKILNASKFSLLDAYERLNFSDIFKEEQIN